MRHTSLVTAVLLGFLLVDPGAAQSRRLEDGRRVTRREPASEDRGTRDTGKPEITRDIGRDREDPDVTGRGDGRIVERRDHDDDRGGLRAITVLGARHDRYERDLYGYDRYGHRRVWGRTSGMSCLQLIDELEWAHDEWHYRNDRYRGARWYAAEHARLEWRIEDELAYSGCGPSYDRHDRRDCRDRGHYPRTDSALEIAILVLDILLGSDRQGRY